MSARRQWSSLQEATLARVVAEQEARANQMNTEAALETCERERNEREVHVRKQEVERRVSLEAELELTKKRLEMAERIGATRQSFPVGIVLVAILAMVMTVGATVVMLVGMGVKP